MFPSNLLTESRVQSHCEIASKKRMLETLAALLAAGRTDLTTESIFERLLERERLGSTALGHGIALPHARIRGIEHPIGACVHTRSGVDFDAIDDKPVDLAFALLVPESADETHLQILATLAEMFNDAALRKRLRKSENAHELFDALVAERGSTEPS